MTDEQFRRFASGLSHIVWRMNPDGARVIAPRWAELCGVAEGELQRDGWLQTIHPEDRAAVFAALRACRAYGSHFDADYRIRHRDGSYHWVRSRGEPVRNSRGEVAGWIGVASNIDDQKRAEAMVRDDEARLRMIIDAARVGTIEYHLSTGAIIASPASMELLGFDAADTVTFSQVMERIHAGDRPGFARAVALATSPAGDGTIDVAVRAVHPNGRLVWVYVRGTCLFENAGDERRAMRFVGVCGNFGGNMSDLAERAMLSTIIASSNDAILATTCDGTITHWNGAAERIFGFEAREMMGTTIEQLVPPDGLDGYRVSRDAVKRGDVVTGTRATWLRRDGARILVSLTLSPIINDNGECLGMSAIVRDITQHARLESEIAHAQKMEAVGLLAGGVAHDLNNLLTSILAGVELGGTSPNLDDETREEFAAVKQDCLRAAGLIRQLLAVAKRQVINPRPCDPNEIVCDLAPMLERALGADVAVVTTPNATRCVFVDSAQIGQVLLSLAANARAAMPNGGILSISTRDDVLSNSVVIEIADDGTGMTPEVQARVFEPFFTTKPAGEGTGLGLSISYGIVAQSRGTLTFDSTPGEGTRFEITLPVFSPPSAQSSPQHFAADIRGDETILVVEDDRLLRDLVVRGLERSGFLVLQARNGIDAVSVMERHKAPIHLVLTDVVMPEMSGADLVAQIRDWYPGIRVLFMSGYSPRAVETYGVSASETELLQKPFELGQLRSAVRRQLDRLAPLR